MAGAGLHGHRVQAGVGRQQRGVGAGGGPPDLRLRVRGGGAHKVTKGWEDGFTQNFNTPILQGEGGGL